MTNTKRYSVCLLKKGWVVQSDKRGEVISDRWTSTCEEGVICTSIWLDGKLALKMEVGDIVGTRSEKPEVARSGGWTS